MAKEPKLRLGTEPKLIYNVSGVPETNDVGSELPAACVKTSRWMTLVIH